MKAIEKTDCSFPQNLDETLMLLADEPTRGRLLAGGTDLMVQWESGVLPPPERVVSVWRVPELCGITEQDDSLVIGASVTHAELRGSDLVQQFVPELAAAAATVGGPQIQARGTIGGNVANASPAGDLAPALLVTDGSVVVASVSGEREVPLCDFFLDYRKIDLKEDELIVRFILPKLYEGCSGSFRKLGTRAAQAISKVMGACRACVEDGVIKYIAISLGSVAATSVRLSDTEAWLTGKSLDDAVMADAEKCAANEVTPIDDIRSTATYRKWVSGRIVRGFLRDLKA